MKLPKVSVGVMQQASLTSKVERVSILPSRFGGALGGAISDFWVDTARQPACRTACRSAQAAAIAACAAYSGPAFYACETAAIVGGNECYNAC